MQSDIYSMTDIAPTIAAILNVRTPAGALGRPIERIHRALNGSERLALLAPDALGMHPWTLWRDEMPYLSSLIDANHVVVRAVMPTITPVNFATMLTGGDQSVHAIATKADDLACESIFDTLAEAGRRGASVGQEDCTMTSLVGRYAHTAERLPRFEDDLVADRVIRIARTQQPDFVITQLVTTDDVFHKYMPSSPEVIPYLHQTDDRLKRLVDALVPLGYGIMILADHGQHDTEKGRGSHGTEADEDSLVPCTWTR